MVTSLSAAKWVLLLLKSAIGASVAFLRIVIVLFVLVRAALWISSADCVSRAGVSRSYVVLDRTLDEEKYPAYVHYPMLTYTGWGGVDWLAYSSSADPPTGYARLLIGKTVLELTPPPQFNGRSLMPALMEKPSFYKKLSPGFDFELAWHREYGITNIIVSIPTWFTVLALISVATYPIVPSLLRRTRERWRHGRERCIRCGYSLQGCHKSHLGTDCPECGQRAG